MLTCHHVPTAPGFVMADPTTGVTVTDADRRSLTVTNEGGDRLAMSAATMLVLDPGTARAFATALLGFADYVESHLAQPTELRTTGSGS